MTFFQNTQLTPLILTSGGVLAILIHLPMFNEVLPILVLDFAGINGGVNLTGTTGDISSVNLKWTILSIPGPAFFLVLLLSGILSILAGIDKMKNYLPERKMPIGVLFAGFSGLCNFLSVFSFILEIATISINLD